MKRLILAALAAALIAGCSAGQAFGPTLRSGCQTEELSNVATLDGLIAAAKVSTVSPERKASLQACGRSMRAAQDACEASPSVAAAAAMKTQRQTCDALVTGGGQ